jgi:hypothetical protein
VGRGAGVAGNVLYFISQSKSRFRHI